MYAVIHSLCNKRQYTEQFLLFRNLGILEWKHCHNLLPLTQFFLFFFLHLFDCGWHHCASGRWLSNDQVKSTPLWHYEFLKEYNWRHGGLLLSRSANIEKSWWIIKEVSRVSFVAEMYEQLIVFLSGLVSVLGHTLQTTCTQDEADCNDFFMAWMNNFLIIKTIKPLTLWSWQATKTFWDIKCSYYRSWSTVSTVFLILSVHVCLGVIV